MHSTLVINPTSVSQKSTVYLTLTVTDQYGHPVTGASVSLLVTKPNGKSSTVTGTTDIYGQAFFQYQVNPSNPVGTDIVLAVASAVGFPSTESSGSFIVT